MTKFKSASAAAMIALGLLAGTGCKNTGGGGGGDTSGPVNRAGGGALHAAVAVNDLVKARELTADAGLLDSRDKYGRTPLGAAIWDGKLEMAKLLLDAGSDPAAADKKGLTPLMWAASRGHNDLLRQMAAKKPNLDSQDQRMFTAIYCAAERSNIEGYKILQEAGANPDLRDKKGRSAADVLQAKTGRRTP